MATKADIYSIVNAMPSQNGPGYLIDEAKGIASRICGLDGAWDLPFVYNQVVFEADVSDEEAHRHEAAFALVDRHDAIIAFAARGAGEAGRPSFHAQLADPFAEPNEEFVIPVDVCLRHLYRWRAAIRKDRIDAGLSSGQYAEHGSTVRE